MAEAWAAVARVPVVWAARWEDVEELLQPQALKVDPVDWATRWAVVTAEATAAAVEASATNTEARPAVPVAEGGVAYCREAAWVESPAAVEAVGPVAAAVASVGARAVAREVGETG